jgi:hypothetical protein
MMIPLVEVTNQRDVRGSRYREMRGERNEGGRFLESTRHAMHTMITPNWEEARQ